MLTTMGFFGTLLDPTKVVILLSIYLLEDPHVTA